MKMKCQKQMGDLKILSLHGNKIDFYFFSFLPGVRVKKRDCQKMKLTCAAAHIIYHN